MPKFRLKLLVIAIGLALVAVAVFALWPKKPGQPLARLRIIRTTVEQGKPVVFFKLEGDDHLRIQIHGLEKVTASVVDGRYDSPVLSKDVWAPGQLQEWAEIAGQDSFWAPSQSIHWALPGQTFGVLALTNVPTWKLRVTVTLSVPNRLGAIREMPNMWSFCRSKGRPFSQISRIGWHMGVSGYTGIFETNVIESDLITNSLAFSGEVTK